MITNEEIKESNYSLFGRNCNLTGDINITGKTYIHSTIDGTIQSTDGEIVILEFHSLVSGKLIANDIVIIGTFHGHIQATGKVILQSTAKVTGTIQCHDLIIMPGAFIDADIQTVTENDDKNKQ